MRWTLRMFHSYHHFRVELRILQRFELIPQANIGLTAYVDGQWNSQVVMNSE